jgi:hypothetical protein
MIELVSELEDKALRFSYVDLIQWSPLIKNLPRSPLHNETLQIKVSYPFVCIERLSAILTQDMDVDVDVEDENLPQVKMKCVLNNMFVNKDLSESLPLFCTWCCFLNELEIEPLLEYSLAYIGKKAKEDPFAFFPLAS